MGWFPRVVLFIGALFLLYGVSTWEKVTWKVFLVSGVTNVAIIGISGFLMLVACLGRLPW